MCVYHESMLLGSEELMMLNGESRWNDFTIFIRLFHFSDFFVSYPIVVQSFIDECRIIKEILLSMDDCGMRLYVLTY